MELESTIKLLPKHLLRAFTLQQALSVKLKTGVDLDLSEYATLRDRADLLYWVESVANAADHELNKVQGTILMSGLNNQLESLNILKGLK